VFQDVATDDHLKEIRLEGGMHQVQFHLDKGGVQPGGDVGKVGARPEGLVQAIFRRQVKKPERLSKNPGSVAQVEPEQPMPLQ
jgi:hypothetical protein